MLAAAIAHSPACVGLDPDLNRLPEPLRSGPGYDVEHIRTFCLAAIDAVADIVRIVKPQSACFERFGHLGYAVLEDVVAHAKSHNLVVVLDAKRGDIDASARHYAAAARNMGADWITVSPYMGPSTIEPFLAAGLGVFALCRTSNPDSDRLQTLDTGGLTLAERTADMLVDLARSARSPEARSAVGAVIGATKAADETARLRARMPDLPFLVPGYGAQGGTTAELTPLARHTPADALGLGIVVNASRSVLYPKASPGLDWQSAIRAAAQALVSDLASLTT